MVQVKHAGRHFYIEYVCTISDNKCFRVHLSNGAIHNISISSAKNLDEARNKVINYYKSYLEKKY